MSELINNSAERKKTLKQLILQLHDGENPDQVKKDLEEILGDIPYGEVVEVEQELIADGLAVKEIQDLCDIHSRVLDGNIDLSGVQLVPPGHPVDTFKKENQALQRVTHSITSTGADIDKLSADQIPEMLLQIKGMLNELSDVDKHYRRKENLLFPFLEKAGITGPPTVMWGKHDEIRAALKEAHQAIDGAGTITVQGLAAVRDNVLKPVVYRVEDMFVKEEQILLPMALDVLTDLDWYEIFQQTTEIGYCLYDPDVDWKPKNLTPEQEALGNDGSSIKLPSGTLQPEELLAMLNTLPIDITFVDKNDRVKYFSQGSHRIFDRNRAILNRDVRLCHPPGSVHIVDQIIKDFRSGKEKSAPFWIQMGGRFIHIEYFAMRSRDGEYLGTLEVSQDLTDGRALEGEQRLLSYSEKGEASAAEAATSEAAPEPATAETAPVVVPVIPTVAPSVPVAPPVPAADPSVPVSAPSETAASAPPEWFKEELIALRFDAQPILASGGHPVGAIFEEMEKLEAGAIFELIVPFFPGPMIEKFQEQGWQFWSKQGEGGLYLIYVKK